MEIPIALAVFFGSAAGLLVLTGRKIPLLLQFSEREDRPNGSFRRRIKERIMSSKMGQWFSSPEVFLQTLLSKIRIFALKLEIKSGEWLMKLRRKAQEKNNGKFSENYWGRLRKRRG